MRVWIQIITRAKITPFNILGKGKNSSQRALSVIIAWGK